MSCCSFFVSGRHRFAEDEPLQIEFDKLDADPNGSLHVAGFSTCLHAYAISKRGCVRSMMVAILINRLRTPEDNQMQRIIEHGHPCGRHRSRLFCRYGLQLCRRFLSFCILEMSQRHHFCIPLIGLAIWVDTHMLTKCCRSLRFNYIRYSSA